MRHRTGRAYGLFTAVALAVAAAALCSAPAAAQQRQATTGPATRPASTIGGTVTAPGDVPLSEMVVYLESPDPSRPMPAPAAAAKVSQKGAKFDPPLVIVTVGQTVDFPNDEDRPIEHNVFSNSQAKRFDLGLYPPGQSKSIVFDQPGAVFLYCSIHRYMDGVIFVSPTPYTDRPKDDGSYIIENVPPGEWVVKTWQRRRRFPELTVPKRVDAGRNVTVDLELKRR
jgi:plastocyanin